MTYSLAVKGARADSENLVGNVTVDDSVATVGGQAGAMQDGTRFLCKNPDGSQSWYMYDAELSIPGVSRVLKPV